MRSVCHAFSPTNSNGTAASGKRQLSSDENATTRRPLMYSYYERIPLDRRFTDMTDEDDDALLDFWKVSWTNAGWEPIVLGRDDAMLHPRYHRYETQIQRLRLDDFAQISLRRYVAMAATIGGGWMCDYDVFPIRDFRTMTPSSKKKFALYNILSPSLAAGTGEQWEEILQSLLLDAQQYINANETQLNMWTDVLSMYAMLRNNHIQSHRRTMPASMLMQPTPWTTDYCTSRAFRKPYLVVHVDAKSMLDGRTVPPEHRLPRFRAKIASQIIPLLQHYCGIPILNNE